MRGNKTLDTLLPGESAYVTQLIENPFTCKLMTLGIIPQSVVTMVRKAPFGGAFYIKLDNHQMAVRVEEAKSIFVEKS